MRLHAVDSKCRASRAQPRRRRGAVSFPAASGP